MIVVINKFASEIIKNRLKSKKSNFKKEGFYRISTNELKGKDIPTLFYGYLGSGRLDNYSRENLEWNIKRALNFSKNKTKNGN